MKHSAATSRRIASNTNPVTIIPPAPKPPAATMARPSNPSQPASTDPEKQRRNRRSFDEVLESLPTAYDEAAYAGRRIQTAELQIAKAINLIGPEAQQMILASRPDLAKYLTKG